MIFMKHFLFALATLFLAPLTFAADSPAPKTESPASKDQKVEETGPLKDQKDKVSYSIGLDIGTTLKRQLIDVNPTLLNEGIQDGLTGSKPLLSDEQVKEVMSNFQ